MSGPKVVNLEAIRRQRQRQSLAGLRRLQDTVAEWEAALQRAGIVNEEGVSANQALVERLENLRRAEDWPTILQELPARIEFCRVQTENANQAVIQRKAAARERLHRLATTAAMLQRDWRASGRSPPPELSEISVFSESPDEIMLARFESMLQDALKSLPSRETAAGGGAQAELILALRAGSESRSVRDWLEREGKGIPVEDETTRRLARTIAEVQIHAPGEAATKLIEKSRQISMEPDPERRAMLGDSLLIEADELCRSIRELEQARRSIRETIAAFEPFKSLEVTAWVQRLTSALENPDPFAVRELVTEARKWLSEEAAREDAKLRREAVLRSLTELGYEIRENMATAWAENGRVVVRKPAETDYGIELTSPAAGVPVQARVVAFGSRPERSASDALRDREVEQTWCGEFQKMRELLEADGFSLALVHATPAGDVPVKVIAQTDAEHRDLRAAPGSTQTRKQRSDR